MASDSKDPKKEPAPSSDKELSREDLERISGGRAPAPLNPQPLPP